MSGSCIGVLEIEEIVGRDRLNATKTFWREGGSIFTFDFYAKPIKHILTICHSISNISADKLTACGDSHAGGIR